MSPFKFAFLLISFLMIISCSKDIQIGSSLLDDQNIDIAYTDTLSLNAKTILGDSATTFFESVFFNKSTHMIGRLDDPSFGISEATIYTNASLGLGNPDFEENSFFDSLILVLPYDSIGTYGDFTAPFNVELYQMDESLFDMVETMDTLYSNNAFPYSNLIGSTTVTPSFRDSFEIKIPNGDTLLTQNVPKHMRIALDPAIGQMLLADSSLTQNDTVFQEFLKGFVVKTDGANNGIMGINLFPGEGAALGLYYTTADDEKKIFSFTVGGIRHNELSHDYFGSDVEAAIQDPNLSDFLYVQSMAGTNISFDLSDVLEIGDTLINKAQLEVTISDLPEHETDFYTPITNLLVSYRTEEGRLAFVEDIDLLNILFNRNPSISEIEQAFGGNIITDEQTGDRTYTFNLTNHIINIRNGEINTSEIELLSYVKQQRPNRTVIYGPNHPDTDKRAKLKLVLTLP